MRLLPCAALARESKHREIEWIDSHISVREMQDAARACAGAGSPGRVLTKRTGATRPL